MRYLHCMSVSPLTRQPSEMEITFFQLMMISLSHTAGWARHLSEMEVTSFQSMMMPSSYITGWAPDRHVSESKRTKQRWAWDRAHFPHGIDHPLTPDTMATIFSALYLDPRDHKTCIGYTTSTGRECGNLVAKKHREAVYTALNQLSCG